MEKRLLRFDATFPEMARGLIVAYRDPMKKVDANTVLVHVFRAFDELARKLTGNDKGLRSKLWGVRRRRINSGPFERHILTQFSLLESKFDVTRWFLLLVERDQQDKQDTTTSTE
jgi:hypothetical protein